MGHNFFGESRIFDHGNLESKASQCSSSPSTLFLAGGNETSRSFTYERKGHKALKHMKRKRKTVEV